MRKPCKECNCKVMDGYHDQNPDKKDKHFFKVLVGNFRERLSMPDKFVQHFFARPPGTVTLESHSGYAFEVKVTNRLGKLVFEAGWKAFASAHDLNTGDFLVFKYDGLSHFKVLIFDPSCCEKVLPCTQEKNDGERCREPTEISSSCDEPPMKSTESNRKAWTQREGSMLINISSSISPSDSSGYKSSTEDQKSHDVPRYILPKRINLTGPQKKKLNEKVRAIHSEIPIYVSVVRKSSIFGKTQTMDISEPYADIYLQFEDETLLLHCHGKSWEVSCHVKNSGKVRSKRLSKGWRQFARENHLQLGDLCLFELVKNKKHIMNVHIIRGNEM